MPGTDQMLDVSIAFDAGQLAQSRDSVRTIAEASHHAATEKASEAGGRLRHPDPREVHVETAIDPLTGEDVMLVSTRWIVDGATPREG